MKNKRAQIQNQVFIYILTLIIAISIFMFGYSAIKNFSSQVEMNKLIDFQIDIDNTFSKIGAEYDSFEIRSFNLPADYKKICFVDHNRFSGNGSYPIMEKLIESGIKNNVFIYSKWLEKSIDVGDIIVLDENYNQVGLMCYSLFSGEFKLGIRGLGDKVEIQNGDVPES